VAAHALRPLLFAMAKKWDERLSLPFCSLSVSAVCARSPSLEPFVLFLFYSLRAMAEAPPSVTRSDTLCVAQEKGQTIGRSRPHQAQIE